MVMVEESNRNILAHLIPLLESPKRQIDIIAYCNLFKLEKKKQEKTILKCLHCGSDNKINAKKCVICGLEVIRKRGRPPKTNIYDIKIKTKRYRSNPFIKQTKDMSIFSLPKNKKERNLIISWESHVSKPILKRLLKEKLIKADKKIYELNLEKITNYFIEKTIEKRIEEYILNKKEMKAHISKLNFHLKKFSNIFKNDVSLFNRSRLKEYILNFVTENKQLFSSENLHNLLFKDERFTPPFNSIFGFLHFIFLIALINNRIDYWNLMEKEDKEQYIKNSGFTKKEYLLIFKKYILEFAGIEVYLDFLDSKTEAYLHNIKINKQFIENLEIVYSNYFPKGSSIGISGLGFSTDKTFFRLIEEGIENYGKVSIISFFHNDYPEKLRFLLRM